MARPRSLLWTLALLLAATLGCVHTGYLRFGEPRVHDSEATRAVLARSGARVAKDLRQADVASIQEFAASRELTALSARAATTGATLPEAAGTAEPPALPEAQFGRTVPEQGHDLRHREGRAVEVELLYDGTGNETYLGRNARVYLLSFEMGIFPTRQSRLLYPFYWLLSAFGDSYDFTTDWFANVEFVIPKLLLPSSKASRKAPRISVYDLVPRFDVLSAREAAAAASQLQLAVAGVAQGGSGQIDYLRRLEEQFAQQRRYPLQLGMIEGPTWWSWAFGTRRHIRERSWLISWIPFVHRFTTDARLEPGMRTGHVILLVEDVEEFRVAAGCYQSPSIDQTDPVGDRFRAQASEFRTAAQDRATSKAVTMLTPMIAEAPEIEVSIDKEEKSCAKDARIRLPILVRANYLKLDQPSRRVPLTIAGAPADERIPLFKLFQPNSESVLPITVDLPLAPEPPEVPGAARLASTRRWDAGHALVEIELAGRDLEAQKLRKVFVRDESRKSPLRVAHFELFDPQTVHAIVALPPAPKDLPCRTKDARPEPCIELSARVVTADRDFQRSAPLWRYAGPWSPPERSAIDLRPEVGGTGTRVTLSIGEALLQADTQPVTAANVTRVLFGTQTVARGESGWWVPLDKKSLQFQAPLPPKAATAVDVIVEFDNGRAPSSAGTFLYR